jgi:hypothetical protein
MLPSMRGVHLLFPRPLRCVRETKWLSRGSLDTSGSSSVGWAIHEVVRWT